MIIQVLSASFSRICNNSKRTADRTKRDIQQYSVDIEQPIERSPGTSERDERPIYAKMANTVLLEARPYRPFKSSEEYLYAMREDLAEWLNMLYPELRINTDNFMDRLDTGVALCKVITPRRTLSVRRSATIFSSYCA